MFAVASIVSLTPMFGLVSCAKNTNIENLNPVSDTCFSAFIGKVDNDSLFYIQFDKDININRSDLDISVVCDQSLEDYVQVDDYYIEGSRLYININCPYTYPHTAIDNFVVLVKYKNNILYQTKVIYLLPAPTIHISPDLTVSNKFSVSITNNYSGHLSFTYNNAATPSWITVSSSSSEIAFLDNQIHDWEFNSWTYSAYASYITVGNSTEVKSATVSSSITSNFDKKPVPSSLTTISTTGEVTGFSASSLTGNDYQTLYVPSNAKKFGNIFQYDLGPSTTITDFYFNWDSQVTEIPGTLFRTTNALQNISSVHLNVNVSSVGSGAFVGFTDGSTPTLKSLYLVNPNCVFAADAGSFPANLTPSTDGTEATGFVLYVSNTSAQTDWATKWDYFFSSAPSDNSWVKTFTYK